ncbi:hypothetical protein HA402_014466 [Bradysia odoriphaga]|nr:hypothetical protein HA402_014466 [Bradysia odoriphaga]
MDISSIVTSTIFKLNIPGEYSEKYHYGRYGTPTVESLELSLADLDGAKYAVAYSSKISASQAILSTLSAGDRVIFSDIVTCEKLKKLNKHIEMIYTDLSDLKNSKEIFVENTKLVWIETPTIPLLRVLNIKKIENIVHANSKALLVVDNTLSTSYYQRPLENGADVAIYSLNEYFGGHNDATIGAVTTNDVNIKQKLEYYRYAAGPVPSPFDCYMMSRSLKTLTVRMERHSKNAFHVAKFLETHSKVEQVYHPSLNCLDNVAHRSCGIVSFQIKGCYDQTIRFVEALDSIKIAETFGGTESHVIVPWLVHSDLTEMQRISVGIDNNLVMVSVGLENVMELTEKLNQALGVL